MIMIKVNGKEVAGGFYSRLIKATIRDEAGQESDSVSFDLDDADNAIEQPPPKATIEVFGGWKESGGIEPIGTYEMQSVSFKWDADSGDIVVIQGKAADLKRKLKGSGREAHDDKTFGEIVDHYAKRNGMTAKVDPELSKLKIKYRARVDTSEIDFLTTLGDEVGAIVKPMGDKLVVTKRGAGKSTSGKSLPPIRIEKSDTSGGEISPEGRTQYGTIKAAYIDQASGKRKTAESKTGLKGPEFTLKAPLPNKEQAEKAALAEAQRMTRNTGEGHFQLAKGRFDAQAEADVIAGPSFRDGVAGEWRCDAVEHVFDESGWKTKIEVKAKEDGASAGKDEK